MSSNAEVDGFVTGLEDLKQGRWDGDNVKPPLAYFQQEDAWQKGYQEAQEAWNKND